MGAVLLALIFGYLWTRPAVQALMNELEAARDHARVLEELRRQLTQIERLLDDLTDELRQQK